jgi:hypothetical protein
VSRLRQSRHGSGREDRDGDGREGPGRASPLAMRSTESWNEVGEFGGSLPSLCVEHGGPRWAMEFPDLASRYRSKGAENRARPESRGYAKVSTRAKVERLGERFSRD